MARSDSSVHSSGSDISRLIVEAYLEQRRVLNDKLVYLAGNATQWTGYPVAHRDITAELARLDGIMVKIATSPNIPQSATPGGQSPAQPYNPSPGVAL